MKKLLVLFFIALLLLSTTTIAQTDTKKSYQFLAKLWTEALGRIPDQQGWNTALTFIQNNFAYYQETVRPMFKSTEFFNNYPTSYPLWRQARLVALYRGALNRDPDITGFNSYLNHLTNGTKTWTQVVDEITASNEFNNLVNITIIPRANNNIPYYGWFYTIGGINYRPIQVVTPTAASRISKTNFNGNQTELQAVLNTVGATATITNPDSVCIAQMAVIYITSQLTVPANVRLTTVGSPNHFEYAKMARIVKQNLLNDNMIEMEANSVVKNLWIDGQYPFVGKESVSEDACITNANIPTNTDGIVIRNNRFTDASGSNFIKLYSGNGINQRNFRGIASISNNLITAYGTTHWTGGVSTCSEGIDVDLFENGSIQFNQIVDITDGAICLFHGKNSSTGLYNTLVNGNQILNAGNSAVAGIVFDQQENDRIANTYNYSGANVQYNTIWTSPSAHIDYPFHIGCRSEYAFIADIDGTGIHINPDFGIGGSIHYNTSGTSSINAEVGIILDGISNTNINDNTLLFNTEAYHSRIDKEFVSVSNSTPSSSQYTFETFDRKPFLDGNRDQFGYIIGPDNVSPGYYPFKFGNFAPYYPSSFNWVIQDINGNYLAGPFTSQNESINIQFNFSSSRWLRIRYYDGINNWRTKYVYYSNALQKANNQDLMNKYDLPIEYSLSQNYPNPFNPMTNINYSIKNNGNVKLEIFDLIGQKVTELVNKFQNAGNYNLQFDGSKYSSGIYIYKISCNEFSVSKKFILMK